MDRRPAGWILASLAAFPVLVLAAGYVASRVTSDLGVADPEREHFALIAAALSGLALLAAVPRIGRALGQTNAAWPAPMAVPAFVFASWLAYLVVEDSRSGHIFETDHALPELLVPMAVQLLAMTDIGRLAAGAEPARRAWEWTAALAGMLLIGLVALAVSSMLVEGGMYSFDQPITYAAVAVAGAYGLLAVCRPVVVRRRRFGRFGG
jgi:hypothetical protein